MRELGLQKSHLKSIAPLGVFMPGEQVAAGPALVAGLRRINRPLYLFSQNGHSQVMTGMPVATAKCGDGELFNGLILPCSMESLGDASFCRDHGIRYPYVGGAMAKGISSVAMVEALAGAGMLGVFGAAGLSVDQVEAAIDRLEEKEQRAINVIIRGNERLKHIVDSLLEAARFEAKVLYMAREAFNPLLLITELVDEYRCECANRDLHLEIIEFPEHAVLRGDIHHLKRAFDRLLENAMKFTPKGGWIRVRGREVSMEELTRRADTLKPFSASFFSAPLHDNYLEITISDSGIGLAKDDQLKIFDMFHEVGDISSHSSCSLSK